MSYRVPEEREDQGDDLTQNLYTLCPGDILAIEDWLNWGEYRSLFPIRDMKKTDLFNHHNILWACDGCKALHENKKP